MRAVRALVPLGLAVMGALARAQSLTPVDDALKLDQAGQHERAIDAFQGYLRSNPDDGRAWYNLGFSLHTIRRSDEAIVAWRRALDLGFAPAGCLYNICCVHAVTGHAEEALASLRAALDARFAEQETLENDTDLDSLRADPRFAELTGLIAKLAKPPAANRDDGWRWDLDFYARRIAQMHWSLHAHVSPDAFAQELAAIKRDIPSLTDDQLRLRLKRLTARIGDGHTTVALQQEGATSLSRLPLHMRWFPDGLFVIGAKDHPELVGARVLKFGPIEAGAALDAARPYASVDNAMGHRRWGPLLLAVPTLLAAIGATGDESSTEITFVDAKGATGTTTLTPVQVPVRRSGSELPGFTYVHQSLATPPAYLAGDRDGVRVEYQPAHNLVYFYFGSIQDTPGQKLAAAFERVFATIKEHDAQQLVIDMRANGGGNTGLIRPLFEGLIREARVNRPGHLWVIIGRDTFSAAQNTVNLIEKFTSATFVGEPTGSRPQFTGESTYFVLPHSKTRVYASSRYWQILDSTDERTWVAPQIAAPMTFADYAAGRDPSMEAILRTISARP